MSSKKNIKKNSINNAIEVFDKLQSEEKNIVFSKIYSQSYSGPIPHSKEMENYERIHPGLADRIMLMAENQSSHRQSIEKAAMISDIDNSKRGQWFAFILGLSCVIGGIFLIAIEKSISGFAILISAIAGLASLFVYGKKSESDERKEKNK